MADMINEATQLKHHLPVLWQKTAWKRPLQRELHRLSNNNRLTKHPGRRLLSRRIAESEVGLMEGLAMIAVVAVFGVAIGAIRIIINDAAQRARRAVAKVTAETKTALQLERELHQGAKLCFAQLLTRYRTGELSAKDAWAIFTTLYPGIAQQMFEQWQEQTRA